jgi:hypothetical protein
VVSPAPSLIYYFHNIGGGTTLGPYLLNCGGSLTRTSAVCISSFKKERTNYSNARTVWAMIIP